MIGTVSDSNVRTAIQQCLDAQKKVHPSPEDWRDVGLVYLILTDRFDGGKKAPKFPWDQSCSTYQGGNFLSLMERLPYLKKLGVGSLWITPVQKQNPLYETFHGYANHDLINVEPRLCSEPVAATRDPQIANNEFKEFIQAAHKSGIYIILDIVLNHVGNIFQYLPPGSGDYWSSVPRAISFQQDAIRPTELLRDEFFTRQGDVNKSADPDRCRKGDFYDLKQLHLAYMEGNRLLVMEILIDIYKYWIAEYDIDGFRIDTMHYVGPELSRVFTSAIKEFAYSIGKRNFYVVGEICEDESTISDYIINKPHAGIAADAAIDFPISSVLQEVLRSGRPPVDLARAFANRHEVLGHAQQTPNGPVGVVNLTFLDNHDGHYRFHEAPLADPHQYDMRTTMALSCLFALNGLPCIYYGTEQGLYGENGDGRKSIQQFEAVREALWGKENAFDTNYPFFLVTATLADLRQNYPALRYGGLLFRQVSVSPNCEVYRIPYDCGGLLAFSRVYRDQEVLFLANSSPTRDFHGSVLVGSVDKPDPLFHTIFSNMQDKSEMKYATVRRNKKVLLLDEKLSGANPGGAIKVSLKPHESMILVST